MYPLVLLQTQESSPARNPFSSAQVIELSVNGAPKLVEPGSNVAQLLVALDLVGKRIAVERNGEIVPRSRYEQTPLANGDRLEIVVAVGGG